MKRYFFVVSFAVVFVGCGRAVQNTTPPIDIPVRVSTISSSQYNSLSMNIESNAFQNNGTLPSKYTCDGENVNPPLRFLEVPAEAKSLALIVDDPDAPNGTWVHWLAWNIDPNARMLPEAVRFDTDLWISSMEGTTSFGRTGYGGPCPPSGTHRYFFKVYALDTVLDLPSSADKSRLEAAMEGHVLASAELIGLYQRKR